MSALPPIPPALASAAGATARPSSASSTPAAGDAGLNQSGVQASDRSGDRDADGRDLSENERPQTPPPSADAEEVSQRASESIRSGALDVTV